jgi:hypothetical protein
MNPEEQGFWPRWIPRWNAAVGAMDALTGVLLMAAPGFALRLMGLAVPPGEWIWVSWIGAFVFAVGACYFFALKPPVDRERRIVCVTVWRMTAMARTVVALFLAGKIASGMLASGWATVAITDAAVAAVQWIGLKRRWIGGR